MLWGSGCRSNWTHNWSVNLHSVHITATFSCHFLGLWHHWWLQIFLAALYALISYFRNLPTTYQPPTDPLPTTTNHLPTTYWPPTCIDHLPTIYQPTNHRPPTDHLPTTYRPPTKTDHLPATFLGCSLFTVTMTNTVHLMVPAQWRT